MLHISADGNINKGFKGVTHYETLIAMIETKCQGNKRRERKEGLIYAKEWLKEVQSRQRGKKKENKREN